MGEETHLRGDLADSMIFKEMVRRADELMEKAGLDAILLTKPQNMMYLLGDGRLCAFAIVARNGTTYVGVPKTDLKDTKKNCVSERTSSAPGSSSLPSVSQTELLDRSFSFF